ncbi:hypothetical protein M8494_34795 [Serratia ureilytica]
MREALLLAKKLRGCIDEACAGAALSNTRSPSWPGTERPFHAMQLARRIMAEISTPATWKVWRCSLLASIGIAHYTNQGKVRNSCCAAPSAMMSATVKEKIQICSSSPA